MELTANSTPSVAVIGLGYVGLPLALSYAMKGCKVYGCDINQRLVDDLNQGITDSVERDGERTIQDILQEQISKQRFEATTDLGRVAAEVSTYIITVGVPIERGKPVYTYLDAVCKSLATVVKRGDLILIRSTVVPGTTEERMIPMLLESGLEIESELFIAYCSERIAEGRAFEEFRTMCLALGGIGSASTEKAEEIVKIVTDAPIHVADIKVVETSKVVENISRDVNIAFVQEIAEFCRGIGIDSKALIDTANSHERVNLLKPGAGVGGFCIPNAFYYLHAAANQVGVETPLMMQSRFVNEQVPVKIVNLVKHALESKGKKLNGSKVAVLGLAMKDYSNDTRLSPALEIVSMLENMGADIHAYDPNVKVATNVIKQDAAECFYHADVLLILTMQDQFVDLNFRELLKTMNRNSVVFDAKRIVDREICDEFQHTLIHI